MDIREIKPFLMQVQQISKHSNKIAEITGENFNVFRTLNLESSEVRTHSAFLAEFLNPKGSHGQGDIYLKLFINQLELTEFDTKSATVDIEKHTDAISSDQTRGGRVDILLTDGNKNQIIIENKIYAGDQKYQLLRYHNYNKEAALFYLTLHGNSPSELSTGKELHEGKYRLISYYTDILQWLEDCKKESVSLPMIRETINQYMNLIRYLTEQMEKNSMSKELRGFIIDNQEYLEAIELCHKELSSIVEDTKGRFKLMLDEKFHSGEILAIDGVSIVSCWGEDCDGVHFGYKAMELDKNVSNSAKVQCYSDTLKKINGCKCYTSGDDWLGWFNLHPFEGYKKFKDLDKKEILGMCADDKLLEELVDGLVQLESEVRKEFIRKLST